MIEKVVLTNMCMIYDNDGNVLVEDRIKSWKGIAFPGGHVEPNESILDSVIREIKEETGLTINKVTLCGVKQWFNDKCRNVCFLFKTNSYEGKLLPSNEGNVYWVKRNELRKMNLAYTFEKMIDVFENDNLNEVFLCGDLDNTILLK